MSVGAEHFKIKVGDQFVNNLDRETLEYSLGDETSADLFSSDDAIVVSQLRKKYPRTLFVVVA